MSIVVIVGKLVMMVGIMVMVDGAQSEDGGWTLDCGQIGDGGWTSEVGKVVGCGSLSSNTDYHTVFSST